MGRFFKNVSSAATKSLFGCKSGQPTITKSLVIGFVAWVALCSVSVAQIELSFSKQASISGVVSPRIVDGLLLVDASSKPVASEVASIRAKSEYKFLDLTAKKSLFESANLRKISDDEWILSGKGRYLVEAVAFDSDKGIARKTIEVVIGESEPPKPEPEPGPGPQPPKPDSLPFAGDGLRVLIVYETSELNKLSESQRQILYGQELRQYLVEKCAKNAVGFPEWRVFDKDVDTSKESATWQDVMKRPRQSVPWIAISNGKDGFEGPLPATYDEALALIKKYAEAK